MEQVVNLEFEEAIEGQVRDILQQMKVDLESLGVRVDVGAPKPRP